jgi:hypothetical protein
MRAENDAFTYPSIGDQYRAKTKKRKIKLTPSDDRNELEYLQSLVILMMKADSRRGAIDSESLKLTGTSITLSLTLTITLTIIFSQTL